MPPETKVLQHYRLHHYTAHIPYSDRGHESEDFENNASLKRAFFHMQIREGKHHGETLSKKIHNTL